MTTCVLKKEALVNVWIEYMGEPYADDRVTRTDNNDESGPSITSTDVKHAFKKLRTTSNWHRLDGSRDAESVR